MNVLDIELANEPLDIDSFSYLSDSDYPYCMLGFQLKNLYDQKRLIIRKEFNPEDVIHFVPNDAIVPKFFRGIRLNVSKNYIPFLKHLETLAYSKSLINIENYKKLLNDYNLKCDNCYAYLNKGVYPIDSEFLNQISSKKIDIDNLYENGFDKSVPVFQSVSYFVIYVLSNKNMLETTTKNYLHTVVKNYTSQ